MSVHKNQTCTCKGFVQGDFLLNCDAGRPCWPLKEVGPPFGGYKGAESSAPGHEAGV